ncbi:MBL fold metallo-hydrolase [Mycolicibacterium diernhoferi]|uniref:MBL fold metallo-hydrolase n=1 Tax=Mycolicibacterium diernhoferi TaxID=1801 RepID=A0A1Q4HLS8_9MYCO|nr:MBL fold metallo-hydrolase [Mycolicibacterium diernhoferi]OJZ68499.1 MBL fold metallo-hydrolase [Mycolicibacterium diernhoferi]OPE56176.1 MBL fold metallo-hydrolase [Mycolicibacterium diernhoferi]PEG54478.1 MBL fold metallo-hydrolase [Mycolicibacterium diernhoferi]QYL20999.1 MBL fold metallo-hydrolase [Mycolicibacterium diernhoferi]
MALPDFVAELSASLFGVRIPGDRAHLLNCYLWVGEDGVTLIDTGWPDSAPVIAEALTAVGRTRGDLTRIVLTHFHEDHAGSAAEIAGWSGAEVVAGAADADYVRGESPGPLPRLTVRESAIRPETDLPPHGPPCRVDRAVADGDVLDFAGGAQILEVPGHTPGSIAVHLPAAGAVLTGDAIAEFDGRVILGVFNTDRPAALRSQARLAALGAEIAGFGHGEAVLTRAHRRIAEAVDVFADPD